MTIDIKCPVCEAANRLTNERIVCRSCNENLSLLYRIKAYSYKYRLYLFQTLNQVDEQESRLDCQDFAQAAKWLCNAPPVVIGEEASDS